MVNFPSFPKLASTDPSAFNLAIKTSKRIKLKSCGMKILDPPKTIFPSGATEMDWTWSSL